MVLQPAAGARVPGPDDLAGEDLQVRHRVHPGAVGQHQVPVVLIGVGADRLGPDQHVADPDRMRVLALQRALVGDSAAAARHVMVDKQPVLQVLARVGEVEPGQLGVAARGAIPDRGGHPDQVPAQRDGGVPQPGVPAQRGVVVRQVHRVVGPVLQADHGQRGAVPDHEFDVVGVRGAAPVVEHDHGPGERLGLHQQVTVSSAPVAGHGDDGGPRRFGLGRDRDHGRLVEARVRPGAHPVGRDEAAPEQTASPFGRRNLDLGRRVHFHGHLPGRDRRVVRVQAAQPAQRGEAPLLLAAAGHGEVRRVVGPVLVQPCDGSGLDRSLKSSRHQPTAPSI